MDADIEAFYVQMLMIDRNKTIVQRHYKRGSLLMVQFSDGYKMVSGFNDTLISSYWIGATE